MKPKGSQRPHRRTKPNSADSILGTDVLPLIIQEIDSWPSTPKVDYLKRNYLSKYCETDKASAQLRRSAAIEKWQAQELVNAQTNERLRNTDSGYHVLPRVTWRRFVRRVRKNIADIIGTSVPLSALSGQFSGGASTSRSKLQSHPAMKYVGQADITASAIDVFEYVLEDLSCWLPLAALDPRDFSITLVEGAKMFTVPKNAIIDRVACKEPDLNMFMQKGCGDFIRKRLRRVGISLNDQGRNRSLAREGSISGSLATVDLSSASDSITLELVRTFLPPAWFYLLDSLRSNRIDVDGTMHECEMFSSMGNGFTFELESLLFYAIARAVAYFGEHHGTVSVYGDDIIVPVGAVSDLSIALRYLGFKFNEDKTFSDGPIRESCGGHYWNGTDITPFFVRGPIRTLTDLIHFLNELRLWASRGEHHLLDEMAWPLWNTLCELIPRTLWGGDRVAAGRFQLVTPHEPVSRLVPRVSPREMTEVGKYMSSLNKIKDRTSPAGFGSSNDDVIVHAFCRIRAARKYGWHDAGLKFLSEL